ncbi:MFS transporter [Xanthovirga aplysinae]|uniref:MFS transporter n=1 Tax=Xanthovirga aplysinae TaxID=2529853 RepID=UPI0012BC001C|nr:MFS transporter [Xanthovirga aplysinae]MTI30196.1 MFS transporter [Xanthovirga aplysinae]
MSTIASERKQIPLLPVLMVNFIGMLGYSIILPFLVFLVHRFGGNEFIYGIMGSIYPAFQFIGAPLLGKWSDRIGRKVILLITQIGTFLAWILFLLALLVPVETFFSVKSASLGSFIISFPLIIMFLARALDGLTGGNVSVANAYLSDISTDKNRKANFGKMAMSASLGFVLGPALAGLLGGTPHKEMVPILVAAFISLVAIGLIWFKLPESKMELVNPQTKKFQIKKLFTFEEKECYRMKKCKNSTIRAVFSIPHIPFMVLIYFLVFLGFNFFYAAFPMHALKKLEWNSFELGIFFSFLSGIMIFVQGPLLGFLSKKSSDQYLVIVGSILLVLNFSLMAVGNSMVIYVAAFLFALGNGLMWPSYLSILSKLGGEEQQGAVQGVANSAGSIASIIGLILGGYLYGVVGSSTFLFAAGFLFLIFLLAFRLLKMEIAKPLQS